MSVLTFLATSKLAAGALAAGVLTVGGTGVAAYAGALPAEVQLTAHELIGAPAPATATVAPVTSPSTSVFPTSTATSSPTQVPTLDPSPAATSPVVAAPELPSTPAAPELPSTPAAPAVPAPVVPAPAETEKADAVETETADAVETETADAVETGQKGELEQSGQHENAPEVPKAVSTAAPVAPKVHPGDDAKNSSQQGSGKHGTGDDND